MANNDGRHPTHLTRTSHDASSFDEICMLCGGKDISGGGWGVLGDPCPKVGKVTLLYIVQETFTPKRTPLPMWVNDGRQMSDAAILAVFNAKGMFPDRKNVLVLGPYDVPLTPVE